ncbi:MULTISPECIES: hypothetical protein [unclassified Streptomyces]|uniref:hypothetical protein n=1 Tax=unclassified Streptomyces TaxID=2593676 RepID=UPI0020346BF0|nr:MULTISPECIES: hypothetical protein [unclassified Streptomyces]MCM2419918.1 hypothetical protein [Streptomyces sp. RKAG293]MCM2427898.1 hypothetical protein [Streptomyces sp. RKAG337]
MIRNVFGSLIALLGAAAAVWSPFRAWYDGRHGSEIRIEDLFNGITTDRAAVMGSLFLPMLFATLITLLGILLRSRLLVAFSGVLVLGFTILWMVRQGMAAGSLTAGGDGLGIGVANALGGGALLLIGAATMSGRRHRHYGSPSPHPIDTVTAPPTWPPPETTPEPAWTEPDDTRTATWPAPPETPPEPSGTEPEDTRTATWIPPEHRPTPERPD